ncbi:fimbrial protein (plasmid) [Klebsiella aerogenes]
MRILYFFIMLISLSVFADEVVNIDFTLHSSDNIAGGTTESVTSYTLGSTLINGQVGIKECDTSGDDSWCANNSSSPMPKSQPTWKYKATCAGAYCIHIASAISTPNGLLYTPYKATYKQEGYTPQPDGSYIIPSRDYHFSIQLKEVLPVGEYTFSSVRVDKLIICKSTPNYGEQYCSANAGNIFIQYLTANIHISVPQSCTVNSGQTVNIELDNASASAFVKGGAGNSPAGMNEKTVSVPIQCLGGGNGTVTMSLHGTSAKNFASSLASSNADIGVKVIDRTPGSGNSGQPIVPNSASSYSTITLGQDGNGAATLGISPVWLGENEPAKGNYTSQSYLQLDYQ